MTDSTSEQSSSKKGTDFVLLQNHTHAGVPMEKGETITLLSKEKIAWCRKEGVIA